MCGTTHLGPMNSKRKSGGAIRDRGTVKHLLETYGPKRFSETGMFMKAVGAQLIIARNGTSVRLERHLVALGPNLVGAWSGSNFSLN
jgi:hypothetical protein